MRVGIGALATLALLSNGCGSRATAELTTIAEATLEVPAAGSAHLERELPAGVFSILVTEDGVDLRTVVTTPQRKHYFDDPAPRHGVQIAYLSLQRPTSIRVEVVSSDHRTKTGRAQVRIARWNRELNAEPTEAELADREYSNALTASSPTAGPDWTQSVVLLDRAAEKYTGSGQAGRAASARLAAGLVHYRKLSSWRPAYDAATVTLEESLKADDQLQAARARMLRGAASLELANESPAITDDSDASGRDKQLASADSDLALAAQAFAAIPSPLDQVSAVNFRAIGRWYSRDPAAARALFEEAAAGAAQNRDVATEAAVLGNLAWLDVERGEVAIAAKEYERLIQLIKFDAQPEYYAAHVANYALALGVLGEFDRALELHTEILDLASARNDEPMRARQLVAIAALSLRAGDPHRALESARTALALSSTGRDERDMYYALRLAGSAAAATREYTEALRYHRMLLDKNPTPLEAARVRVLLAHHYRKQGMLNQAEGELRVALRHAEPLVRAEGLAERGLISSDRKNFAAAVVDLREADRLYDSMQLDFPRIDVSSALSRALLKTGDVRGALTAADVGIRLVSTIRVKSANAETRARFLGSRYSPFEARVSALLSGSTATNVEETWSSLETADAARARTLLELIGTRRKESPSQGLARERQRDRLTLLQLRLESLLQQEPSGSQRVANVRREIEETRARFDAATDASLNDSGDGVTANPISPRDLQKLLGANTAIAYFFVGEFDSYVWLITQSGIQTHRLPPRHAIDQAVTSFVSDLQHGSRRGMASASSSCCELLQQITKLLAGLDRRRIIVVPDGAINSLPMAALPLVVTTASERVLVDKTTISYATSLRGLSRRESPIGRKLVAVVADPVYSLDDPRIPARVASPQAFPTNGLRSNVGRSLTRLPYSGAEARAIKSRYAADSILELSGFDATRDRIAKLPFSDLGILHIAAHAVAREDTPALSALYLSAFDSYGRGLAATRITADEIRALGLRADIVVLSGCSTAAGSKLQGEGILGLTHSFLANDSRAVIASLWPVPDGSTARFMADFYDSLQSTAAPDEALAAAQRSAYRRQADSSNAWASFVLRINGFPARADNERGVVK